MSKRFGFTTLESARYFARQIVDKTQMSQTIIESEVRKDFSVYDMDMAHSDGFLIESDKERIVEDVKHWE